MKKVLTLALALGLVGIFAGCSNDEAAPTDTAKEATTTAAESTDEIKTAVINGAPHGDKSFGIAAVTLEGDKIVSSYIDEFQFMDPATSKGVPNADGAFGESFKDSGKVLASKNENSEQYSKNMKEKASATNSLDENMAAIHEYVKGKTVAELEATLQENPGEKMIDVVSGSTLADTEGYVKFIVDAAKAAK
ncbi:hypothetical protein R4Z10_02215 [Niallia sp. XMNu-256]|uniref:hypothetical protein n=1 Tax=Niallia sp. XMNu-256 TaxID=3082444 RepID=UPI0030CEA570